MFKDAYKFFALACVLCAALCGCKTVVSLNPVGTPDTEIDKDRIEGVWQIEESVISCKFTNDGKTLIIGSVEWDDATQGFKLQQSKVWFTKVGDRRFLNLENEQDDEHAKERRYSFTEYMLIGDKNEFALVWPPDFDVFKETVAQKKLEGTATEDTVTISEKPETLMKVIQEDQVKGLFDYREPMILRRIYP